jgi:hypothetical protein
MTSVHALLILALHLPDVNINQSLATIIVLVQLTVALPPLVAYSLPSPVMTPMHVPLMVAILTADVLILL